MPSPGEPMWLDGDTEAALAWQEEQALSCPGCGKPTDETMAPGAAYIAEPLTCASCRSRDLAVKAIHAESGDTAGLHWSIRSAPGL